MPPDEKTPEQIAAAAEARTAALTEIGADWRTHLLPESVVDEKGQPVLDAEKKPVPLRGAKGLERYKDVAALARGHLELERTLGGATKIPGEGATPEEVAAYRTKIGVPGTAEGYDLKLPEIGVPWDPGGVTHFKTTFHEAGVTPAQAQKIIEAYGAWYADVTAKQGATYVAGLGALREKWGEPTYNRRTTLAARVVKAYAPQELKAWFDQTRVGDHPLVVEFLGTLGERFAEDGVISGLVEGVPGKEAAAARIAEIEKDGSGYWKVGAPDHDALVAERFRLQQILTPGSPRTAAPVESSVGT